VVRIDWHEPKSQANIEKHGRLNRRTLTMVWAEHRNIRWIISARRANAKERAEYDAAGW
jgi:uncharacterized DUF497 family protein